ncbi:hypothetical protein GVO57_13495 [Sphingomonas changnyeongensis]|uniref:Uncharacterized protein n=1 Tax=Sphingomonas changnyeongensis TaxID=2698679 RepID=A0A7Z2NXJ9_9SPHN|nr:hypothetical protein [Sphingomonas changnyeongensis]QHL91625.1 hypothetical protein GVO57_13495 [Sphingomonas changnyeongensis]
MKMTCQQAFAPAPTPRKLVRRLMDAAALTIGGPVLRDAGIEDPRLANCLIMPLARLLICGTACHAPLLHYEAGMLQKLIDLDALIVRPDAGHEAVFDIRLRGDGAWHCGYRLWLETADAGVWLVPPEGQGRCFLIGKQGIEASDHGPFAHDERVRQQGHARARLLLAVARQGWY